MEISGSKVLALADVTMVIRNRRESLPRFQLRSGTAAAALTVLLVWQLAAGNGQSMVAAQRSFFFGCYERERVGQLEMITDSLDNCVTHCEKHFYRYAALADTQCLCLNTIRTRVLEDKECDLKCRQNNDQSCGGTNAHSFYETGVEVPGPVKNLKVTERETETTIKIAWNPPVMDGVPVESYEITATAVDTFASYRIYPMSWTVNNNSVSFELSNLTPGTRYNISVSTVSEKGTGGTVWLGAQTEIGIPDPEPEEPVILRRLDSTIQIEIPKATNNNGPINYYRVVVHYVNDDLVQQIDESFLDTFQRSKERGVPYYVAAELEMKSESLLFTVGDGRYYRTFFNPPIPSIANVHISIDYVSILNSVFKVLY